MDEMMTHEEINQWIIENIKKFKNWYHPVDFGDGIVVHCTDEKNMPQPAWDEYHGINKWEKMIKPYAPKIKGKRILDIGCNTGIIDIHLVKKGAKEVVGIDRGLPFYKGQDYVEQAEFVKKAFELKENREYPILYYRCDLSNPNNLRELNLGKFDLILAMRVLNYFKEKMPEIINVLSEMSDNIIVHTNNEGYWKNDKWCNVDLIKSLLEEAGFNKVSIKYPKNYEIYPVIIGKRVHEIEKDNIKFEIPEDLPDSMF